MAGLAQNFAVQMQRRAWESQGSGLHTRHFCQGAEPEPLRLLRTACLVRDLKPIIPRPLIHACLAILKSLRSASPVAALSVQSTSTEHPFLVVCGPCCLPALT